MNSMGKRYQCDTLSNVPLAEAGYEENHSRRLKRHLSITLMLLQQPLVERKNQYL